LSISLPVSRSEYLLALFKSPQYLHSLLARNAKLNIYTVLPSTFLQGDERAALEGLNRRWWEPKRALFFLQDDDDADQVAQPQFADVAFQDDAGGTVNAGRVLTAAAGAVGIGQAADGAGSPSTT
jgi:hypothetical protein